MIFCAQFLIVIMLIIKTSCDEDNATILVANGPNKFNCKRTYAHLFATQACDINFSAGFVYLVADVGCFAKFFCNDSLLNIACCSSSDDALREQDLFTTKNNVASSTNKQIIHHHFLPRNEKLSSTQNSESESKLRLKISEEVGKITQTLTKEIRWCFTIAMTLFGVCITVLSFCKFFCYRKMQKANQNLTKCIQGLVESGSPVKAMNTDNHCQTCHGAIRVGNQDIPAITIPESSIRQENRVARRLEDQFEDTLNESMITNDCSTRK